MNAVERDALAEVIYRNRIANCAETIENWQSEDEHPLLCRVLRAESEQFADAILAAGWLPPDAAREALDEAERLIKAAPRKPNGAYQRGLDVAALIVADLRDRRTETGLTP